MLATIISIFALLRCSWRLFKLVVKKKSKPPIFPVSNMFFVQNCRQEIHWRLFNTCATAVLSYSFGVITWTYTKLEALDINTRKLFSANRSHLSRSSLEQFHLPRKLGVRGIPTVSTRCFRKVGYLRKYFHQKAISSPLHRAVVLADNNLTPLKWTNPTYSIVTPCYDTGDATMEK